MKYVTKHLKEKEVFIPMLLILVGTTILIPIIGFKLFIGTIGIVITGVGAGNLSSYFVAKGYL